MKLATNPSHVDHNPTPVSASRIGSGPSTPQPDKGPDAVVFDSKSPRRALTEREKQILRLVCDGLTNAEIAPRLGISSETVKSELKRIFRKIEVKNRTQAAVLVVKQGLLEEPARLRPVGRAAVEIRR